ncbi:hypothetical protein IKA92_05905 [bacterium]|nr:hypothetical protein [bacterium]
MKKKVFAYLHTHWDREWYRTKEEFNIRLVEVVDGILDELKKNNAPCFYFDGQTAALIDYLKFRPEKEEEIKTLIKEKKLFMGPFFVSSDSFLINSNFMEKNLELGINFSKKMGQNEFIGYFPDSFGHSREITKLCKKFGIDKIILWRGASSISSDFLMDDIKITRLPQGYFFDALHSNLNYSKKAEIVEKTLDKISEFSKNNLLFPIGGDHLGIVKNANKQIKEINKYLKNYEIILCSPFEYFKNTEYKENYDGEFLDNSENYILGGVYSVRINEKIKNFDLMTKFEKIEKLDNLSNNKYKVFLDNAKEKLIKNHAHDSIYGCSTDSVNNKVKKRFEDVSEILNYVERRILFDLEKPKKGKIGVYNLGKNSNIIKFKSNKKIKNAQIISRTKGFPENIMFDINRVPITEDWTTIFEQIVEIEPIKENTYSIIEAKNPIKSTKIEENLLENNFIKIEIKNSQIIFEDKKTGEIYQNFFEIINTKDLGDSYNYVPSAFKKLPLLKTKIVENGEIRSKLRLFYKNIFLDLILTNNSKNLEFEVKIKNKEKNHKLQIQFNLKDSVSKSVAGDLYTSIKREHNPDYRLIDNMPPKNREEVKLNTYPMQKYVWAQSFGIFTKGISEYETFKNTISIPLLRSIGLISTPKNPARFCPAGPPIPIQNAQEIREINLKFMVSVCEIDEAEEIFEKYLENYIVKA